MKNKKPSMPREKVNSIFSLYSNGQFQEAVNQIKALNENYPNEPLLFNIIGACYKELAQLEGAIKMFEIAISLKSDYAEAYFNLGTTLQSLFRYDSAVKNYRKAIEVNPNYPDAHNNLGNTLLKLGKYEAAVESFEWAVAYKHDFAEAYNNLGNALNEYGRIEEALASYQKAITIKPDYVKAYFNLALVFKDLGNKIDFIKNIEKVLNINPQFGAAYYHLSQVKKFKKNDSMIANMQLFLNNDDLDTVDRINLNFALARVFEVFENHDKQFKYLDEGNRLRKNELNYSIDRDLKLFSRIKQSFSKPPSIIKMSANPIRPIFIVGMPRSGTSLVHQIFDSHHEVYGAGELNNLNKSIFPLIKEKNNKDGAEFSQKDLLHIRNQYLDYLSSLNVDKSIIVDKMPINFRYVGFILTAIPEAKIIHMKRNPMATCWSIYKSFFNGNSYSFNQEDLAQYYNFYLDLMVFWNKSFQNKIYELCYEDLTTNQEKETRKLLEYSELDWDENCLNFHINKTAVKTTSSMQVRQKMYQGSSEVWKKYEAYLQPLINGLNQN